MTIHAPTLCPPEAPDVDAYVETYIPGDRGSFEKIRCASYTGVDEYGREVFRVDALRTLALSSYQPWEPVVVRLMYGDVEHMRTVIA